MYTFAVPYGPQAGGMPWAGGQQMSQGGPPSWMGGGGGFGGGGPSGPPSWMGGGGGGGKGKRPATNTSKESYFESNLRPEDIEGYGGAGLLLYRTGKDGVEVLLATEKPWNPIANEYDPLAWNPLGGKKTPWTGEWEAAGTAGRCLMEVFGGCKDAPTKEKIEDLCRNAPVLWYPAGRFAMFISEFKAEDMEVFAEAPKFFAEAKEEGKYPFGPEEQRVNSKGQATQRWVKQIEQLEWVPGADLLAAEKRTPVTDLLKNISLVSSFMQFLQEGTPPCPPPSPPAEGEEDNRRKGGKDFSSKGGGKGKNDGGKKGGGKDKGGKDKGGKGKGDKGGGKNKGMPYTSFAPMPPPPMNPQMYPIEMQRQMLGEKLYMTVQPMVTSPMVAQKVTGMLLELPMPELMPLLGGGQEERNLLKQRVDEAMEVLEAEDAAAAGN